MSWKLDAQIRFRLATVCAVPLCLSLVSVVAAEADAVKSRKGSLLLFGSSSVNDTFGHLISEDFERLGFSVARHGYAAAGLSRPDFRDLRDVLAKLPIERDVSTVMFYVGANDAQALWLRPDERPTLSGEQAMWINWDDQRWSAIYEARVAELFRAVCTRGAKQAIMLAPVDVNNERRQARLDRIRQLQAHAAALSECGHFVPTGGDKFSVGEPLRAGDGFHMTRSGAQRVWQRVRQRILSLLVSS
jgi:hypothetical protein